MAWAYLNQYDARLVLLPSGNWMPQVRVIIAGADDDAEWRSVDPNGTGYATGNEAVAAAEARITAFIGARKEAISVEVVRFLVAQRLRSAVVQAGTPPAPTRVWQAQAGVPQVWGAQFASPQLAVRDGIDRDTAAGVT